MMSFTDRLKRVIDVPECVDKDYKRGKIHPKVRDRVMKRQKGKCFLCLAERKTMYAHHIIPNGPATPRNLAVLCFTCHHWVHHIIHRFRGWNAQKMGRYYRR